MEQNENVFVLGANLRANKCYPRLFKNNFPKLTLRIEAFNDKQIFGNSEM